MPTILVVDDEPRITELMRDWLTLHRYEVVTASNGHDALRLTQEHRPDLILLDVMMPDLSGIEVCRRLRSERRTASIPIILVSGRDPSGGRVEGLLAGASDYVTKPVNLPDLNDRIQVLLARGKSLDRSERLLYETVHAALAILPCQLVWLLSLSADESQLVSRAIAASGDQVAARFMRAMTNGEKRLSLDLSDQADGSGGGVLARAALFGAAEFNLSLSDLRQRGDDNLARACEAVNLGFVTAIPLQGAGAVLGTLLLGTVEPLDVETTRGQQLLAAAVGQAATAADNARLVRRLLERESQTTGERVFYELVLDTMPDGLLLVNDQAQITFANRRLTLMTGHSTEALMKMKLEELCIPDDQERVRSALAVGGLTETSSFEITLLAANGNTLPVLITRSGRTVARKDAVHERVLVLTDIRELNARKQALLKQSGYLVALNRASQAASSTGSLDEALKIILNEALSALGAKAAVVLLLPPDAKELFCHTAAGPFAGELKGQRFTLSQSIAGYVVREYQPVLLDDAYSDERFKPALFAEGMQIRAIAVVPISVQEEAIGVIEVISDQERAFTLEDIQLLQGLARSAAMAIENASLFGETQRQLRELRLLLQVSEAASSTLTLETVLETISRQLLDALHVTWCTISSWERGESSLVKLAEIAEISGPGSRTPDISLKELPRTWDALKSGTPFATFVDAPDIEPLRRQALADSQHSSVLVLPVAIQGKVVGLAELYHASGRVAFSAVDIDRSQAVLASWRSAFPSDLSWDAPECLQALGRELLGATGTAWCAVFAYQANRDSLCAIYETGQTVWPVGQGESYRLDETSLRRIALMERTAVTARLDDPHLSPADRAALTRIKTGAMLLAPLIAHGEAIGIVEMMDQDARRTFSESELNLAQAIANVIGSALENGRLYSALAKRAAQLEAAYNDLRDADRTTDEMIQNVSHELRTPLASIIGYADMLAAEDLGTLTEEQKLATEVITTQSRLLTRMVGDIVTVQEVGNEPLERHLCSLSHLANLAIQSIRLEAAKNKIEFVTDFSPDLPEIYVDEERILQVFENLLNNAVKFSPDGGKVLVSIRDIGHSLQVDITDHGIGMPPEEHAKIWRRFYQVDGSRTRRFGGLGLGLTIVKQVVEEHEGHVSVESLPDQGSTFIFSIPKLETSIASRATSSLS